MAIDGLQNMYANGLGQLGAGACGIAGIYYPATDRRTKRQRLEDLRASNVKRIEELMAKNEDIDAALALLTDHPVLEKLDNLVTKLLG